MSKTKSRFSKLISNISVKTKSSAKKEANYDSIGKTPIQKQISLQTPRSFKIPLKSTRDTKPTAPFLYRSPSSKQLKPKQIRQFDPDKVELEENPEELLKQVELDDEKEEVDEYFTFPFDNQNEDNQTL